MVQRIVRPAHSPKPACSVDACDKPARTRGWCPMHYTRWSLYGDPLKLALERMPRHAATGERLQCTVEGCSDAVHTRGYCRKHYGRWSKHGDPLTVRRVVRARRSPEDYGAPTKECCTCREELPREEFRHRKDSPDGLQYECKRCVNKRHNLRARHRYETDPEYRARRDAYLRRFAKTKGRAWERQRQEDFKLSTYYGLSREELAALVEAQGNMCAICGRRPDEGKRLAIDHNHDTGRVRALLCSQCNTGLGQFGDDPERLVAAAEYLLKHKS